MNPEAVAELAPNGVMRAGINLQNFLLVSGKADNGDPVGVAPDMARAVADRLGVPVEYVPFASPGELADEAGKDVWDIGLIGAEPQRAEIIAFTPPYCEIEATYLVRAESPLEIIEDVDREGIRIAVFGRSAYGLWLERNLKHAELLSADSIDDSWDLFVRERPDALAGLKPRLISDVQKNPAMRMLAGRFTSVQQAIGTGRVNTAGSHFLADFVEEAKASGLVADLISKHGIQGLSVAPAA